MGIPAGCQTTIRRRPEHYGVAVVEISAPGVTEQAVAAKTSPGEGAEGRAAVVRTGEKELGVVRASRRPSSRALAGVAMKGVERWFLAWLARSRTRAQGSTAAAAAVAKRKSHLPSGTCAAWRHRLGKVAVARYRSGVPSRSSTATTPVRAVDWRVHGQWRRGRRRQRLWRGRGDVDGGSLEENELRGRVWRGGW